MKRIARSVAMSLIVVVGALSLTAPPAEVRANSLEVTADLAINIPSSVLAAASADPVANARLANSNRFKWAFLDERFGAVSGTLTESPSAAPDVLPVPDLDDWNELVDDFRAPATPPSQVTKVVGGVATVVTVYPVGARIGHDTIEFFGFESDGVVCTNSDGWGEVVLSILTGTDCAPYDTHDLFVPNLDADSNPIYPEACATNRTSGGSGATVCFAFDGSATHVYRNGTTLQLTCVQTPSPRPSGAWYINYQTGSGGWLQTPVRGLYHGTLFPEDCGYPSNGLTLEKSHFSFSGYNVCHSVNQGCSNSANWGETVAPWVDSDPSRVLQCVVVGSDGITYVASTEPFRESEGIPDPVCPVLPWGVHPTSIALNEVGAGNTNLLWSNTPSQAYTEWLQNYPECANGSCLLDLLRLGQSCFDPSVDCEGWATDPLRNSLYICKYGTQVVALSECAVYGPTFDPGAAESGGGYGDPADGADLPVRTTPDEEDLLALDLLIRGWEEWNPASAPVRELGVGDEVAAARALAAACHAIDAEDDCRTLSVFAPGDDIREAAQHGLDAIRGAFGTPQPHLLNRADPPSQPSGWYANYAPCNAAYNATLYNCDEYPFASTLQAGPGASLRVIDRWDNQIEGSYLQFFYGACGISDSDLFAVVPVVTSAPIEVTHTSVWCAP
jgi:hypothetical protein